MEPTRAVEKHARRNRALGWAIGLAISASVLFAGAWLKGRPVIGFSYWLVPDGVSLAETCMVVVQLGVQDAFAGIPGYEIGLPPSPLLLLLYSWSLSMIGPLGFVWVNAVVLFWISWRTSPWIVLSLPCLLVAIAMPSKEILLAPLTLVGWWALGRRRFLTLTLTCGLAFLVRDGAGIAICVWIIGSLVAARLHVRGIFIVAAALVSGLVIHVWLGYFLGALFLIDRNVVAFGSIDSPVSASAFSTFGYAVRWFANLTALAFRPALPLDTESNVPVLAVSYWLCGLTILATAQDSLRHLLGRPPGGCARLDLDGRNAALALWLAVVVFSVNPMVQPRYLIPFAVPYAAWMFAERSTSYLVRVYAVLAAVSLLATLAQWCLGMPGVEPWQPGAEWPEFKESK